MRSKLERSFLVNIFNNKVPGGLSQAMQKGKVNEKKTMQQGAESAHHGDQASDSKNKNVETSD